MVRSPSSGFQAALTAHSPFHDEDGGKGSARKHLARNQER